MSVTLLGTLLPAAPALGDDPSEFVSQMNKGKAHLENREADPALEAYKRAAGLRPDNREARINLALAHLLARQKKDPEVHLREALKHLGKVMKTDPEDTAAHYLSGLAHGHLNEFEKSVGFLEAAVRLDPVTPPLRYQLAQAYKRLGRHDEAEQQLRKTIELDPLHASAHYQLAIYARKAGRKDQAREHMKEFSRLRRLFGDATREPTVLERCRHTRVLDPEPPAEPPPAGLKIRFADVTAEWTLGLVVPAEPGCVFGVLDADADDHWDVLLADSNGQARLWKRDGGQFTEIKLPEGPKSAWKRCLVADYDNDGNDDVFLIGPGACRLLHQSPENKFQDATDPAGLAGITGTDAVWVDFDHDGDVDLLVAGGPGKPASLWLNRGNGTFETHSEEAAVPQDVVDVVAVAAGDLNTDDALDVILGARTGGSMLLTNAREGRFDRMREPPGPWPSALSVAVDDINNDGYPDVLLVGRSEAVLIDSQGTGRRRLDLTGIDPVRALLFDYNNDGWLDVCVLGANKPIVVWRSLGKAGFKDVTESLGLKDLPAGAVTDAVTADFDGDGDSDLLLAGRDGPVFLRNDGGNANHQVRLALRGLKTNRTGLGARVEIRVGTTRVCRTVSRLPVEIGTGPHERLDSLRVVWTNGVVQSELGVAIAAGKGKEIKEKKVATGSCPFLYAWDGQRFRFVTDILGNAPLGLSAARGKLLPADPTEHVRIGNAADFVPRHGRYVLQVTDEFREVLYLDQARLVAVDHPLGTEVHPRDKIQPPPFPPSELWVLRNPLPLRSATGDDGMDLTRALSEIDGRYTHPAGLLIGPLRGIAEPHSLIFDFGALPARRSLVLVLTGWLQYGDASVNVSASQNPDLSFIFPRLEVEVGTDAWQEVDAVVGMPAGKTKTILVDLTHRLPVGARRLRLTTTFELRWDRVALLERVPDFQPRAHTLPPITAELHYRGFSEIAARGPHHPTTPDYDDVSPTPPWRRLPAGWCTRYGDVRELLDRPDDRFAILNGGDELTLAFDADKLPPIPPGHQRTFFFYSVGWDKDADHNVRLGHTVEPLPFHTMDVARYGRQHYPLRNEQDNWQVRYNTRFVPQEPFGESNREE